VTTDFYFIDVWWRQLWLGAVYTSCLSKVTLTIGKDCLYKELWKPVERSSILLQDLKRNFFQWRQLIFWTPTTWQRPWTISDTLKPKSILILFPFPFTPIFYYFCAIQIIHDTFLSLFWPTSLCGVLLSKFLIGFDRKGMKVSFKA